MQYNIRTRGGSHKKKKINAVVVKKENSNHQTNRKRKSSVSPSDESLGCGVATVVTVASTVIAASDAPPVHQPPKNKTKAFYSVGKDKVNISFRVGVENYTNMVPYMSKEIYSNFSYQYKLRRSAIRSTRTSYGTEQNVESNVISLSNYSRCYVEDFMVCEIGETVLVLLPTRYLDDDFSIWGDLMSSDIRYTEVGFTKQSYRAYIGTIATNPKLSHVKNGMHISDYTAGFGNNNFGCNVTFHNESETSTVLITWKNVLDGKRDGVMVWRKGGSFRNVFINFSDRCKTNQGMLALINTLFLEVFGDRVQCMHLVHCYFRKTILMQQQYIKQSDVLIKAYAPIDMNSEIYDCLLTRCDGLFKEAIERTYTEYVVIGSPIISRDKIESMVELYKTTMPSHFNAFFEILGFKTKSRLTVNLHLQQSGYYERQVFYNMLAMARQRNPHKMKYWAMISSGANYGRGIGEIVNRRATYLGASTTTKTFIRIVKPFGDAMIKNITSTLSHVNKTVWMLDNNQRGHPRKFQRFGSSNKFVKVTGRTSKQCIVCTTDIGEEDKKHPVLTYVDQAIINPIAFPSFEIELEDLTNLSDIHACLTRSVSNCISATKIDITGKRVSAYISLNNIASVIRHTITPLLTGYVKTTNTYKAWKHQPKHYIINRRWYIMKHLHADSGIISTYKKFQRLIVEQWNPASIEASALIIPPVSLRDEIKTDGYGMAIIEILCLAGILIKATSHTGVIFWELHKEWENKMVYLCMDGLSLDRHRSFQKKLVALPFSYHKSFEQSLVFQKSLSRVVQISGPLHIAFHMLQSIFVIYKDMMRWCQQVLDVKKINVNKVSDSFDTCRRHCYIVLEELERLAIDIFLESTSPSQFSDDYKSIDIAVQYMHFIENNRTTDDRRKYFFGFIIMASEFRKYWTAVRCGDRIIMEQIQNKWIGVHLLSGKHKCVENYLTALETEYKHISNTTLQEVRSNISCRYHTGKDSRGNVYPLHPLDEVQENVNAWTKRILLGPDEQSWKVHSPNVACAHMCVNFEETEYVKGNLDYSDLSLPRAKKKHRSTKTIEPINITEKARLYEWCLLMFQHDVPKRQCLVIDGYRAIKRLKTKLKAPFRENVTDDLEQCINTMFSNNGFIDDDVDNSEDNGNIDDNNNEDGLAIDSEVVEMMHDDYNYNNMNMANGEIEGAPVVRNNTVKITAIVNPLGLCNIFECGRSKMVEMKIPEVRERKQNRMKRSEAFFLSVHDMVTKAEQQVSLELNRTDNTMIPNPWFRNTYRTIIN